MRCSCGRWTLIVEAWAGKYRDDGLVVIGVHSPEFPFEHDLDKVRSALTGGPVYQEPRRLRLNQWALSGNWAVQPQLATLNQPGGRLVHRFHGRDVNLVLGAAAEPVRFRMRIDGAPPRDSSGLDVDEHGTGTVSNDRLYQLIRKTAASSTAPLRSPSSTRELRPTCSPPVSRRIEPCPPITRHRFDPQAGRSPDGADGAGQRR
jgi:hypothetical protein